MTCWWRPTTRRPRRTQRRRSPTSRAPVRDPVHVEPGQGGRVAGRPGRRPAYIPSHAARRGVRVRWRSQRSRPVSLPESRAGPPPIATPASQTGATVRHDREQQQRPSPHPTTVTRPARSRAGALHRLLRWARAPHPTCPAARRRGARSWPSPPPASRSRRAGCPDGTGCDGRCGHDRAGRAHPRRRPPATSSSGSFVSRHRLGAGRRLVGHLSRRPHPSGSRCWSPCTAWAATTRLRSTELGIDRFLAGRGRRRRAAVRDRDRRRRYDVLAPAPDRRGRRRMVLDEFLPLLAAQGLHTDRTRLPRLVDGRVRRRCAWPGSLGRQRGAGRRRAQSGRSGPTRPTPRPPASPTRRSTSATRVFGHQSDLDGIAVRVDCGTDDPFYPDDKAYVAGLRPAGHVHVRGRSATTRRTGPGCCRPSWRSWGGG